MCLVVSTSRLISRSRIDSHAEATEVCPRPVLHFSEAGYVPLNPFPMPLKCTHAQIGECQYLFDIQV